MSFLSARIKSFANAARGIGFLVATQPHAWIHAVATVGVIAGGFALGISRDEWCLIMLAIGAVWCAEAVNTAIEQLCDKVSPERDPLIGRAKDLAAGAVLLMAIACAVVGLIVFGPRVLTLIRTLGIG